LRRLGQGVSLTTSLLREQVRDGRVERRLDTEHQPVEDGSGHDLAEAEHDADASAYGGGEDVNTYAVDVPEDALPEELHAAPDEERGDAELTPLACVGFDAEDLREQADEQDDDSGHASSNE